MTDRLGYRCKVGVLVPAFNATLQPELEAMRPDGVTHHVARIEVEDGALTSDREQQDLVARIGPGVPAALRRLMPVGPAVVLHGISIPTFWHGPAGARRIQAELETLAGVPAIVGALACEQALDRLGHPTRLAIITPYQPVGDAAVRSYFEALGYEIVALLSLLRPSHQAIAHAQTEEIVAAFKTVAASRPDAILQVGTNLAAADLAAEAERWIGLPAIAINAAIYWAGLRRCSINDSIRGFGRLLEDH
jgi:maleate isomerase